MFNLFNPVKTYTKRVAAINALEGQFKDIADNDITAESAALKHRAQAGESLDALLPRAFALTREAARRTLHQRHYDVQLIGGMVLHDGKIAEMVTGEGKTLVATCAAYLNALSGKGVHLVTVNDYLAKRDAVWMGQIYHLLGMSVAIIAHDSAYRYDPKFSAEKEADIMRDTEGSFHIEQDYLRPVSRAEAYAADITYGTNHEFGFDYLRDNLAYAPEHQVQRGGRSMSEGFRGHAFAIIDEVDSILIDEARTPLIISAPDAESSEYYKTFSHIVSGLARDTDYVVDEKIKVADITQDGIDKVEKALGITDLYAPENLRLVHYLQETLRAYGLFKLDTEYVVADGEIVIVDQFTGRLMHGRRFSGGLHQAIEAKEGVKIQQESRTYAEVSIQNYFRMYTKLAGMTGTAQTSAEEFDTVYKLDVVTVPTNRPMQRKDTVDLIYKSLNGKFAAVVTEVKRRHELGQPMLIGTAAIEKNELLSKLLTQAHIPHEILNAKNHEREGAIIAQAGRKGSVTVATNMAGRGVDIILGGNPPKAEEAAEVRGLHGLHVIGTERHEARRIDNQLRGRAGRQGDEGSSQFFMSLEDDLLRVFGGDRLKNMMEKMDIPEDMPIESRLVGKIIEQAQMKVEGSYFDARKHLLEYDDVLNKQRSAVYAKRQAMLQERVPIQALYSLDMFWMTHLEDMESLRDSVRLRSYAQHDPLVEYRREGHILYQQMFAQFEEWMVENAERFQESTKSDPPAGGLNPKQIQNSNIQIQNDPKYKNVGRNDPCPCNSGLKFKKCHGA